jgi:hypothetical protein
VIVQYEVDVDRTVREQLMMLAVPVVVLVSTIVFAYVRLAPLVTALQARLDVALR